MPSAFNGATRRLYTLYWVLLVALVGAFVIKAGMLVYWGIGATIICVTIALYVRAPIYALCTLPGTLLLGIIARVRFAAAGLHVGDVHLFALSLLFVASIKLDGKIKLGSVGLMPLAAILLILSWLFSVDFAASTVTMFGIAELFLVFCLTVNLVQGEEDAVRLLRAWCGTVTLCSALVIISYIRAEPLILDVGEASLDFTEGFGDLKTSTTFFARASFFTTGFNYPLACTLVMLVVLLLLERSPMKQRLFWFGALLLNVGAAVLMGNRSVMAAAAGGSLFAIVYLARYKRLWVGLAGLGAAVTLVVVLLLPFVNRVVNATQLLLFLERIQSDDSLLERLKTWSRVGSAVLHSPHALLIGLGPDASTRGDEAAFVSILGTEHGVDSQFFFILLNYGVIILTLYLRYFLRAIRFLFSQITGAHRLSSALILGSLVTWLILGIGQQPGASKTVAIGVQLAAIVELWRMRVRGRRQPPPT